MTKRKPVSDIKNIFFDSQQVDDSDLTTEQNFNSAIQTGLINNHIGSGVLPEVLNQNILFDSLLVSGLLDGISISAQNQPADNNLGNQLEVELTDSLAAGSRAVKIAIIGLNFAGDLQYDTFIFRNNEKQVSKKHYAQILTLLFNDLIGDENQSFNLGGRVIIKEAKPLTLSRDTVMISQDLEPNLFFRDFFVSGVNSLSTLLKNALPLYNIDSLNINVGYKENKILAKNDVSSQVGQKFLATTDNIQKISLLLSVQNTDPGMETDLAWLGDLIVSIYPLQSTIDCPTDIVPNLDIDFAPANIPLAQLSFNYSTLQANGITLDGNPQPVDFIFSNTPVATGKSLQLNKYYAVAIKRSGSATKCDILVATGEDHTPNSRTTIFTGTVWVDIPEEDLWFRVYTDAAKISDGQCYETGNGLVIEKTININNIDEDYCYDGISFANNDIYTAIVSSSNEKSVITQDARTGNPVYTRQQYVPSVSLLNSIDLSNLQSATEPLAIGIITDKNKKFFDASASTLTAAIHSWTFVQNELVIKIIDDITDGYRYDANVNSLVSNLLNGDLFGAKFIPDITRPDVFYRIADARLCSMIYGDVNGDGIINDDDLTLLNKLSSSDLNISPPAISTINTDGYTTTFINGYATFANPFVNDFSLTFQIVNPTTNAVVASGIDGILVVDPNDGSLAAFNSASTNFANIANLINLKLVIFGSSNEENNGAFFITDVSIISNNIINIRKLYYTAETLQQILRADLNGDFIVDSSDGYLLQSYLEKTAPFPPTSLPSSKIGTRFNILKIKVDPFLDRQDDFTGDPNNRNTGIHIIQDIYNNDGYFESHDFKNTPITFNIIKQLVWEERIVIANSNPRFVPTVFSSSTGLNINQCDLQGIDCNTYAVVNDFDPGKIDFFVPNDLIIGNGGELTRSDGSFYKVDFEVGHIVLEIPDGLQGTEKTINMFDSFVVDYNGEGITRLGFPAMRFADCSTVKSNALFNNQVKFNVSIQSFSPNTNGLDIDGYEGVIVDGKMGIVVDNSTGMLTINFTNLYEDITLSTLSTKIQITVYLKKSGFNNNPIFIDSDTVRNLLELI